jgi:hypothetical protein
MLEVEHRDRHSGAQKRELWPVSGGTHLRSDSRTTALSRPLMATAG